MTDNTDDVPRPVLEEEVEKHSEAFDPPAQPQPQPQPKEAPPKVNVSWMVTSNSAFVIVLAILVSLVSYYYTTC